MAVQSACRVIWLSVAVHGHCCWCIATCILTTLLVVVQFMCSAVYVLFMYSGGGAVYVFWIHHQESRQVFNFTGRRDVRRFLRLAHQVTRTSFFTPNICTNLLQSVTACHICKALKLFDTLVHGDLQLQVNAYRIGLLCVASYPLN